MRATTKRSPEWIAGAGRALPVPLALWLSIALAGCTSHTKKKCPPHDGDCVICPTGICGGYYPTCWRMWPAECPTCPVTPALAPTPVFQAPIEGELVVPPFQSKAGRPMNKPMNRTSRKDDLVSHRRPHAMPRAADHTPPPARRSGGQPAAVSSDFKPSGPARQPDETPARQPDETPAGDDHQSMRSPRASSLLTLPSGAGPRQVRSTLQVRRAADSAAPVDHPAVAWLFSSASSAAIDRESPRDASAAPPARRQRTAGPAF